MTLLKDNYSQVKQVKCKYCGSAELWKNSKRRGKQCFKCKKCRRFIGNIETLPRMRYKAEHVLEVRKLYKETNLSQREIRRYLWDKWGIKPSPTTISDWLC